MLAVIKANSNGSHDGRKEEAVIMVNSNSNGRKEVVVKIAT